MSRLNQIGNWETLAHESRYSVTRLAKRCGVSPRQMERFAHRAFGLPAHAWLHALRLQQAWVELHSGVSAKVAAIELGYKAAAHFSRDFKKEFGLRPSQCVPEPLLPLISRSMSGFVNKCRVSSTH